MDAPTIAQVKAAEPAESLWHFLTQLPATMEAQLLLGLLLAGIVGMIANYTVKWAQGQIAGSLISYLFVDNPRGTLLSFFGFVGVAMTSITAGIFTADAGGFVGWTNVLWFGLTNGFAVDAIANKAARPIWTEEKRAAVIPATSTEIPKPPTP